MQRATTVSNSLRRRSLSRNRPWRFLGKRRVIGHIAVETHATEPAIGQIEVDLLAQPPLRANAEAVADNQHTHHQLGIDRGPSNVAVVGPEVRPQAGQIDEAVDLAKQVIVGDMTLKAEAVEQRLLHHPRHCQGK